MSDDEAKAAAEELARKKVQEAAERENAVAEKIAKQYAKEDQQGKHRKR